MRVPIPIGLWRVSKVEGGFGLEDPGGRPTRRGGGILLVLG